MEPILNNPLVGTQANTETPQEGQPQPAVVPEEQYKSLQSDYTKRVEGEIKLAAKLVQANPQELKTLDDPRVQNAVAKQLYGVDTYAQLIAVYGENFHMSNDEKNLDETELLKRKVNLLEFKAQTESLENWITSYVEQNKSLFPNKDAEEKLRNELKYISSELPIKDRISKASQIVFGNITTPENSAYKQIGVWTPTTWGTAAPSQINQPDAEKQKQIDLGMKLLKLK